MQSKIFIAGLVISLIGISCDNKKGMLPPVAATPTGSACDSITYAKGIKTLLDDNCKGCHQPPFANAGHDFSTYSTASNPFTLGEVKKVINNPNNPMPPSGLLPQSKIDSILCWIDRNAPL
jgi:hypothetical protein